MVPDQDLRICQDKLRAIITKTELTGFARPPFESVLEVRGHTGKDVNNTIEFAENNFLEYRQEQKVFNRILDMYCRCLLKGPTEFRSILRDQDKYKKSLILRAKIEESISK